jgi:hypothetical protein
VGFAVKSTFPVSQSPVSFSVAITLLASSLTWPFSFASI